MLTNVEKDNLVIFNTFKNFYQLVFKWIYILSIIFFNHNSIGKIDELPKSKDCVTVNKNC